MPNRDTGSFRHPSKKTPVAFDKRELRRDVLSAISRLLADGKDFTGHDGRQYTILPVGKEESTSETFIEVVVNFDEGNLTVAKYALSVQEISR